MSTLAEHPIIPRLDLEDTGELRPETVTHHLNRYRLAASNIVKGCAVIDACCGTGYGTELLRRGGAGQAIGVDQSPEAISQAAARYPLCRFLQDGGARFFSRDEAASAQPRVITFFEAIEHMEPAEGLAILDGAQSVLDEEGSLFLSTPSNIRADVNPDHVTQWTLDELGTELGERFESVDLFGQDWDTGKFTHDNMESASFYIAHCTDPIR